MGSSAAVEWVYGVTFGVAPEPDGETGVDGVPVHAVRDGELAALASAVPLERFGEEPLKAALESLERLEALARAHEQVIERMLARGAVVPFRLCTIYADEDRVREMLARERDSLAAALDRLRGTAEWGVKAYRSGPADAGPVKVARSGTEWLQRKREERSAADAARDTADDQAAAIHMRLAQFARAAALARPLDRRVSGDEREMLLNGSYLVPDERTDGFRAVVEDLDREHAPHGLRLELTGPWAPYHFVTG